MICSISARLNAESSEISTNHLPRICWAVSLSRLTLGSVSLNQSPPSTLHVLDLPTPLRSLKDQGIVGLATGLQDTRYGSC